MRVYVIGSAPAVWGFALAGVGGRIVESSGELIRALDDVLEADDLGVVLITDDVASMARERVENLMARSETPLIVEIPGPEGPSPDHPTINQLLRRAIGVKV
ncbi:MAG: V-type ATP synthase subunit F [Anaerolineae bacterium]